MTKSIVACVLFAAAWGLGGPNDGIAKPKDDKPKGHQNQIKIGAKWYACNPGSMVPAVYANEKDKGKYMCIAPGGAPIGPGWPGDGEELAPPPKPGKPDSK